MRPVREPDHARLRRLLQRFRRQEQRMREALERLEAEREHCERAASHVQVDGQLGDPRYWLRRLADLQAATEHLATELVHVRLAIAGAAEELATAVHSRPTPAVIDLSDDLLAAIA